MKLYWDHAVTLQSLHGLLCCLIKLDLFLLLILGYLMNMSSKISGQIQRPKSMWNYYQLQRKAVVSTPTGRVSQRRQAYKLGSRLPWQANGMRKEQCRFRTKEWSQPSTHSSEQGNLKTKVINPPQMGGLQYSSCSWSKDWLPWQCSQGLQCTNIPNLEITETSALTKSLQSWRRPLIVWRGAPARSVGCVGTDPRAQLVSAQKARRGAS